jgi:hypothetical protein
MKLTVIAVAVLGLIAADAMAAGRRKPDPYAIKPIESPFKGVVGNVSPASVSVKGEVQLAHPDKNNPSSKSTLRNFSFSIKGASLTRNGKPCELKDIQKGDMATVTFTTKQGSDKRTVSKIDVTK